VTIADGIAVRRPGDLTFAHVSKLVDDVVTVTDEDLSAALLVMLERHKMVVEPAGSAAVAALLTHAYAPADGPVVAILSGGNIDPMLLLRVIEHGLASAGRFLRLAVRCDDRPGELARLLSEIAEQRANVVDVAHSRQSPRLNFGEVEVALSVETRGQDHSAALISQLRASGYRVSVLVAPGL
jgi:threonine dehydratase